MKKLLGILILSLFLITPSQADDIRDFQIEGMSIGDSLLDYLSEEDIKKLKKNYYPKSKKFVRLLNVRKNNEISTYETVDVYVKEKDKKYIIKSINGILLFKNNIHECYAKKKEIVNDVSLLANSKGDSYIYNYPNDKSKSDVTNFEFSDGMFRVWCTDYSKKREKNKANDHLSVTISSAEYLKFLKHEAR